MTNMYKTGHFKILHISVKFCGNYRQIYDFIPKDMIKVYQYE